MFQDRESSMVCTDIANRIQIWKLDFGAAVLPNTNMPKTNAKSNEMNNQIQVILQTSEMFIYVRFK